MFNEPKLHTVEFKGSLKKFGKKHRIAAYTPAECIYGLAVQNQDLYNTIYNGNFVLTQKTGNKKEILTFEDLRSLLSLEQSQTIIVEPYIVGETGSAEGDTVAAGVGILVLGIILSVCTFGAGAAFGGLAAVASTTVVSIVGNMAISMALAGAGLMAAGIAGLLAPQKEEEKYDKFGINVTANHSKQGVAVPLVYGHIGVGSNLVSSAIGEVTIATDWDAWHETTRKITYTDLISEGVIEGLVSGGDSIILNNSRFSTDGKNNFNNSSYTFATGAFNPVLSDNYGVSKYNPVQKDLDGSWQAFSIIDKEVDKINITLKLAGIYHNLSNGKTKATEAYYQVEVSEDNKIWHPAHLLGYIGPSKSYYQCEPQTLYGKRISRDEYEYEYVDCSGSIITFKSFYPTETRNVGVRRIEERELIYRPMVLIKFNYCTKEEILLTYQFDISYMNRNNVRYFRIRHPNRIGEGDFHDSSWGRNTTTLLGYAEHIDIKMNYDGRAICQMVLNYKDFQGEVPNSRIYEVKGLRVDVPTNYDPERRIYTGVWDGTFKKAWTNNPAWIFLDLLINNRYGLGRVVQKQNIDKWSLYKASQYCDELVPDGNGGLEPRFTFNGVIHQQEEAYDVLKLVGGVFRAMTYVGAGTVIVNQDAPAPIKRVFGNSNVVDGVFSYEGTSSKARHTAIHVKWINPALQWQEDIEIYEVPELISKYGYNVKEVVATGCTSRGQAQRIARHIVFSEEFENDTVSFQVGIGNNDLRPGDIIMIQDMYVSGEVLMGAIKSITRMSVTLDIDIVLKREKAYQLLLTDTQGNTYTKNIKNTGEKTNVLRIASDHFFTSKELENFKEGSFWLLNSDDVQGRCFKVLGCTEDEDSEGLLYNITALLHNDAKYKYIDENISFTPPKIEGIENELETVSSFQVVPYLYKTEGVIHVGAELLWSAISDVRVSGVSLVIRYPESEGEIDYGLLTGNSLKIENIGVGEIVAKFKTYSVSKDMYGKEVTFYAETTSPYANPPAPINLQADGTNGIAVFKWDKPDYDFPLHYEYYIISPAGTEQPMVITNNATSYSKAFNKYPAKVECYVRTINEVGMTSDYVKVVTNVQQVEANVGDLIGNIDSSWLTQDSQELIGVGGLFEQISHAMLRGEFYNIKRMDKTDEGLAFAMEGISAVSGNLESLASKFVTLGAFVGEQLKSEDPDKFYLKWYDEEPDPENPDTKLEFPRTPNPMYDPGQEKTPENYPYLPAYPKQSLAGQITEVYAGNDFVKAQITNDLRVEMNGVVAGIKESMVTTVGEDGTLESNYSIRLSGTNSDGQPVIGGFGLHSDGYETSFGVDAHTFFIRDPEWKIGDDPLEEYVFITKTKATGGGVGGTTYIGTKNTIFKGRLQSLNYKKNTSGFLLDPNVQPYDEDYYNTIYPDFMQLNMPVKILNSEAQNKELDSADRFTYYHSSLSFNTEGCIHISKQALKDSKDKTDLYLGETSGNRAIISLHKEKTWNSNINSFAKCGYSNYHTLYAISPSYVSGHNINVQGGSSGFANSTRNIARWCQYDESRVSKMEINPCEIHIPYMDISPLLLYSQIDDPSDQYNIRWKMFIILQQRLNFYILNSLVNAPQGSLLTLPFPNMIWGERFKNRLYKKVNFPTELWIKEYQGIDPHKLSEHDEDSMELVKYWNYATPCNIVRSGFYYEHICYVYPESFAGWRVLNPNPNISRILQSHHLGIDKSLFVHSENYIFNPDDLKMDYYGFRYEITV